MSTATNEISVTITNEITRYTTNLITAYTPEVAAEALNKSIDWFQGFVGIFLGVVSFAVLGFGVLKYLQNRDVKKLLSEIESKAHEKEQVLMKQVLSIWEAHAVGFKLSEDYISSAVSLFNLLDIALQLDSDNTYITKIFDTLKFIHTKNFEKTGDADCLTDEQLSEGERIANLAKEKIKDAKLKRILGEVCNLYNIPQN
jgi:hypothetical protein